MNLNIHHFSFQILEDSIETLYRSLNRSSTQIFALVQHEIDIKGIYNPKNSTIENSENNYGFEAFQETLRNLNNFIYYNSLLLVSFSIFEIAFKRVCEFVEKYSVPNLKFESPNRNILKNCRKYLSDSTLVNFNKLELDSNYNYLTDINKVRNQIAHENGNLFTDKSKPINEQTNYFKFQAIENITIMNNGQFYINDDIFIKKFIEDSESFIRMIVNELKKI